MGHKRQYPNQFLWQTTSPVAGLLPLRANQSIYPLTGTTTGAMTSTNVIYSQIIDMSLIDNIGLEVTWTGTPTGTFQVMVSNSGINFYALTFNPALTQPSGTAGGYAIDLNQLPFKYLMLQYTNASGSGALTIYGQQKDVN